MIEVDIVYKSKLNGKWYEDTKTFTTKENALKGMYLLKNKGIIIDGWRCDDPYDNEYLERRFKL